MQQGYMNDIEKQTFQDEILLSKLREILLKEDRAALHTVQEVLDDPEKLSNRISPIIEHRLDILKQNFPEEYERIVTGIIEKKIKDSQDDLLDVIYPVLGKMIRKYVNQQFQVLKDNIDGRIANTFSSKSIIGRLRALVFGVRDSELLLSNLDSAVIEEVYVIERDSGILMGSYSRNSTIDKEVIAGMLTAIKSFVEDAFQREREDLELIQYGTYKILIQNFHTYYIAIALGGTLSSSEKAKLSTLILDFAEKELKLGKKHHEGYLDYEISEKLQTYFTAKLST